MRVIIEPDYEKLSQWAANYVIDKINAAQPTAEKPFVLGLPTGSSPIGMYQALVKANQEGRVSFKHVLTFNMDEYVGCLRAIPRATILLWLPIFLIILTVPRRIFIFSTVKWPRIWRLSARIMNR